MYEEIKQDVCLSSISGGTDIVSCFVLGNPIGPVWRGEIQAKGLGLAVEVFDENGVSTKDKGELVCTKPFPAMPLGFWNDADGARYHAAYFEKYPNVWRHGDWCELTEHGGMIIYGRSDAVLNPGGVRIGTAEIYTLSLHDALPISIRPSSSTPSPRPASSRARRTTSASCASSFRPDRPSRQRGLIMCMKK